jgi:hypothetical protein
MAYATLPIVQEYIAQFTIDANSKPTTTQATAIIDDISNEIDVLLASNGWAVPVTVPAAFLDWLSTTNAYGAAAGILKSMFPHTTGPDEEPAFAFWEERYKARLQMIIDGVINLPDATANSNQITPSTYLTRNPDTEEAIGVIAEPLFSIGKVF